jgi:2-C-methyl-D-erythritol 4-phosphate cytidylyltransferase/2-C-methyl-D-erythritol 2,4-cyclodiphosphate synthase
VEAVGIIIAAGGRGLRLGAGLPKQLLRVGGRSLLARSIEAFVDVPHVAEIVVVVPGDVMEEARRHAPAACRVPVRFVAGGARRQDSVARGFRALSPGAGVILVHDAARAFVTREVILRTIDGARRTGAAIAAVPARDTIKRARLDDGHATVAETLPRETIYQAQTPQGFRRDVLRQAIALGEAGVDATDEAGLAELAGFDVSLVDGDAGNLKVTTPADLAIAAALAEPAAGPSGVNAMRVGLGYDSHRLVAGRPLVLGGVVVPFEKGLAGHSDADVIAHAVTDAVLGAATLGDIGQLFPDDDPQWSGADSLRLLARAAALVRAAGFAIVNVDVTLVAERPKLAPHRDRIRENLAGALGILQDAVSVKAKTNEGMDAVGRGEAMVAHAIALVRRDAEHRREP